MTWGVAEVVEFLCGSEGGFWQLLVEHQSNANYFLSGNPSHIEMGWENSNSAVVEISQEQF